MAIINIAGKSHFSTRDICILPGVIHVPLPNITSAAGLVETKRILEERGMWEEPKIHFDAKASESEMSASLRYGSSRASALVFAQIRVVRSLKSAISGIIFDQHLWSP